MSEFQDNTLIKLKTFDSMFIKELRLQNKQVFAILQFVNECENT